MGGETCQIIRVHIFVEGQTEETFVREVLYHHFLRQQIYLNPILVKSSAIGKGGIVSYGKVKSQVYRKCREYGSAFVTTMFYLYRLPSYFTGFDSQPNTSDPFERATYLKNGVKIILNEKAECIPTDLFS